jgi:hypothetical protein
MPSTARRTPGRPGILLLLLATALLGACQLASVATREWSTSTTNDAGGPHTVTVVDGTGNVAGVEFFPEDADLFGGVTVAPGRPDAIDVTWTGGSCDAATDIEITATGGGMGVAVAITGDGNPCDAMGTPRAVRLTLNQPVPPANVIVTQGGVAP